MYPFICGVLIALARPTWIISGNIFIAYILFMSVLASLFIWSGDVRFNHLDGAGLIKTVLVNTPRTMAVMACAFLAGFAVFWSYRLIGGR